MGFSCLRKHTSTILKSFLPTRLWAESHNNNCLNPCLSSTMDFSKLFMNISWVCVWKNILEPKGLGPESFPSKTHTVIAHDASAPACSASFQVVSRKWNWCSSKNKILWQQQQKQSIVTSKVLSDLSKIWIPVYTLGLEENIQHGNHTLWKYS
jgi:hypothetical protein